jgi:hypothetical protein
MTKGEYVTRLKAGPCKVVFSKVNGEEREMNCTLEESVVPAYEKRTDRVKAPNDNTVSVWDLDKSQWRSFTVSSVISFEELPHGERYPR